MATSESSVSFFVHFYEIDSKVEPLFAGSAMGWNIQVTQPIVLKAGSNRIDLLCMTLGLQV